MSAWADYTDARMRLVQEWHSGKDVRSPLTPKQICDALNRLDVMAIRLMLMTDAAQPVLTSSRAQLYTARQLLSHLLEAWKNDEWNQDLSNQVEAFLEEAPP